MIWSRLSLVTPPADPVSLLDAKAHLRVDHADDDLLIGDLIKSAAGMIEGPDGIGYALEPQTWLLTLDEFEDVIRIPLRPVVTIVSVRYLDADGVERTVAAEDYRVSIQGGAAILTPVASWPPHMKTPGAVRVEFTAGAGTPAALRAAILVMVGHLYANREAVGQAMAEVPLSWDSIVSRYRSGVVA